MEEYEQDLEENLRRLHAARPRRAVLAAASTPHVHPESRWQPRRARHPTLEDKIVQGAVAEVLAAVYEADFLGFSYGFRPGRSPHDGAGGPG